MNELRATIAHNIQILEIIDFSNYSLANGTFSNIPMSTYILTNINYSYLRQIEIGWEMQRQILGNRSIWQLVAPAHFEHSWNKSSQWRKWSLSRRQANIENLSKETNKINQSNGQVRRSLANLIYIILRYAQFQLPKYISIMAHPPRQFIMQPTLNIYKYTLVQIYLIIVCLNVRRYCWSVLPIDNLSCNNSRNSTNVKCKNAPNINVCHGGK